METSYYRHARNAKGSRELRGGRYIKICIYSPVTAIGEAQPP